MFRSRAVIGGRSEPAGRSKGIHKDFLSGPYTALIGPFTKERRKNKETNIGLGGAFEPSDSQAPIVGRQRRLTIGACRVLLKKRSRSCNRFLAVFGKTCNI